MSINEGENDSTEKSEIHFCLYCNILYSPNLNQYQVIWYSVSKLAALRSRILNEQRTRSCFCKIRVCCTNSHCEFNELVKQVPKRQSTRNLWAEKLWQRPCSLSDDGTISYCRYEQLLIPYCRFYRTTRELNSPGNNMPTTVIQPIKINRLNPMMMSWSIQLASLSLCKIRSTFV